jgi:hypothetical protein
MLLMSLVFVFAIVVPFNVVFIFSALSSLSLSPYYDASRLESLPSPPFPPATESASMPKNINFAALASFLLFALYFA